MNNFVFFADRPVEGYRKSDFLFILSVILLWGLGIVTILISTATKGTNIFGNKYYFVINQLVFSGVGFIALLAFAFIPLRVIRKIVFPMYAVTLLMCLLCFIPGIGPLINGAHRWISIPHFMTFQPSELAKFVIIIYLAHLFVKHGDEYSENQKEYMAPLIALFLIVVIVFLQKDLSTGVLIFVIGLILFIISGTSLNWLIPLMILAPFAAVFLITIEPFRLNRIVAFLHKEDISNSFNYQQQRADIAISSGGIWGAGMGTGMNNISKVPEVQSDYIFAGWANAMGLVGVTAFFILLIFFAWRGFKIAFNCPSKFGAYGAFGCTFAITLQSILNCGVVCGAFPTTGMPLPFFSSGGSSLICTMAMCGFIINASHADADELNTGSYEVNDDYVDIENFLTERK